MLMPERVSQVGYDLIKKFENLAEVRSDGNVHAYRDPVGVWTIGWGHTKGVKSGQVITKEQAEQFLSDDVGEARNAVRRYIKVPLTQNQYDALVSFTFNLGSGNLRSSTLLRKLNAGDYDSVPYELSRWNKGRVDGELKVLRGLTRRRSAEAALFMMDEPMAADGGQRMTQKPRAGSPEDTPLKKDVTVQGTALAGVGTVLTGILASAGAASASLTEWAMNFLPFVKGVTPLLYITLGVTLVGILMAAYSEWKGHQERNT